MAAKREHHYYLSESASRSARKRSSTTLCSSRARWSRFTIYTIPDGDPSQAVQRSQVNLEARQRILQQDMAATWSIHASALAWRSEGTVAIRLAKRGSPTPSLYALPPLRTSPLERRERKPVQAERYYCSTCTALPALFRRTTRPVFSWRIPSLLSSASRSSRRPSSDPVASSGSRSSSNSSSSSGAGSGPYERARLEEEERRRSHYSKKNRSLLLYTAATVSSLT